MLSRILLIFVSLFISIAANADDYSSHSSISMYRSSYQTYHFFSQSIEGGFGSVYFDKDGKDELKHDWKSMNLRSEFGLEALKFFQFSAGLIKSDYSKKGETTSVMDRLSGFIEAKMILSAPMMNIEVGAGSTASSMQVVTEGGGGSYAGSGIYYTASFSRFLNSRLSLFARGSMNSQHFVKDSGSVKPQSIDIDDKSVGLGLRFYM